jgi:lipopolysaccharide/colanic/teichoic acid biosynthesis glycosyltransferase
MRILDFFLSFLGLIILSPVLFVIGICIRLGSRGPILFRQKRVGKDGIEFSMYKFRTMRTDAENGGYLTVGNGDKRITTTGSFLRKYKLDELPQLINVLAGDMSVVGPRPEVKKYVDLYSSEERAVLNVLPGMTDFASIAYKDESELLAAQADPETYYIKNIMPDKIKLNQAFITSPTPGKYFKVIFLTLRGIFS